MSKIKNHFILEQIQNISRYLEKILTFLLIIYKSSPYIIAYISPNVGQYNHQIFSLYLKRKLINIILK